MGISGSRQSCIPFEASCATRFTVSARGSRRARKPLAPATLVVSAILIPVILTLPVMGRAQEVFAGGAPPAQTTSDSFSSSCEASEQPNIWKQLNVNPLTCHPQTMGQDATGQCTLKGATLVAHQNGVCYYCEPQVPQGTLYIPIDMVGNVSPLGYSCGASPVDPNCMAVCWRQSNATTVNVPPPAQPNKGGTGGPPNGSPTGDPCHPYYDLSTAAGRAAMQANAQRDAQACNESRCQHNPELDVCKTVAQDGGTPDGGPGSKGFNRGTEPVETGPVATGEDQEGPWPVNPASLDAAMNACLSKVVPYWHPVTISPSDLTPVRLWYGGKKTATPSPYAALFQEAQAMAVKGLGQRDSTYKVTSILPYADQPVDETTGWLYRCLQDAGLAPASSNNAPTDPRKLYQEFLGLNASDINDPRVTTFFYGYGSVPGIQPPYNMLPPGQLNFGAPANPAAPNPK